MRTLRDLDDYETAELVRKKTEACVVGFVTPGDDSYDTSIAPSVVDSNGVTVEKFEPGLIAYLRGGKDIKFNTPSANGSYEAYKRACLRTVAAGWRIPYELLSSDLSGVNYSSIRAGLVEFRRLVSASQWQLFIPMFCQPTWDWFCEAAYLARLIPVRHIPCEWAPPKFVAVDPLKDATADLLAIRTGTRTLAEVIAEHGRNPDDVINEIAAMNAKTDSLGLVLDSDPRKVAKTGAMQTADSPGVNAKTD
jgi:lambda family phage portal protein